MPPAECNYGIGDKEPLAIVTALVGHLSARAAAPFHYIHGQSQPAVVRLQGALVAKAGVLSTTAGAVRIPDPVPSWQAQW